MPRHVLIDTDAGVDDALALLLALRSPELHIDAITTVSGNVHVDDCTRNVHTVCAYAGLQNPPPIVRGAAQPLSRSLVTAPEVHGGDGLGGMQMARRWPAFRDEAVGEIIAFAAERKRSGTIIALGPLTNIARAILTAPKTMSNVKEIVTMGGAFHVGGNTGPASEFNYYVDPEAAATVFNSGIPVTIVPLDLTQQFILFRSELVKACSRRPSPLGRFILGFTEGYMRYHVQTEHYSGAYLHDPLAVAAVVAPSLFRRDWVGAVSIETSGRWLRGMTSESRDARPKQHQRCFIARQCRFPEFRAMFLERLTG